MHKAVLSISGSKPLIRVKDSTMLFSTHHFFNFHLLLTTYYLLLTTYYLLLITYYLLPTTYYLLLITYYLLLITYYSPPTVIRRFLSNANVMRMRFSNTAMCNSDQFRFLKI